MKRVFALGLFLLACVGCSERRAPNPVDELLFSTDQMYLARTGDVLEFKYPSRSCVPGAKAETVSVSIGISTVCPEPAAGGILETIFSRGADAIVSIGGLVKLFDD